MGAKPVPRAPWTTRRAKISARAPRYGVFVLETMSTRWYRRVEPSAGGWLTVSTLILSS